jgi:hypothetical protein
MPVAVVAVVIPLVERLVLVEVALVLLAVLPLALQQ